MSATTSTPSRQQVLTALAETKKFILISHENPDGDALGSLVAMSEVLRCLGSDSLILMSAEDLPLPYEYRSLGLKNVIHSLPNDVAERTFVFLDCGNIDRNPADISDHDGARILNIDHHHDNTLFGTVNHVVADAACTTEIIWDLMHGLGVSPNQTIAEALYVGLVTDTGMFMYENTGTRAHEMAAELIAAGVDVHGIYRQLYEGIPFGKLQLLARGLANVERHDNGVLTLTHLTADDYQSADAQENYSEGIVDHLRSVEGTLVAALVRDRLSEGHSDQRKVSLRACDNSVDVSLIARAQNGGGHRQAAGFTTTMTKAEIVAFLRHEIAAQI